MRLAFAGTLILTLVTAGFAGWLVHQWRQSYAGWSGASVDVVLEPGMNARAMIDRLAAAGVIEWPWIVRLRLAWSGASEELQAGEYRFEQPGSPRDVLARLRAGDVLLHEVTVPEGMDVDQIVALVAEAGFGEEPALRQAFADTRRLREIDTDAADLEGYLFPDTYRFSRAVTPETIVDEMVSQFSQAVGVDYDSRAEAVGLTVREAVTLASLIEKETSVLGERRRISAVFHNRLRRRMLLQCDPTVRYAHKRAGKSVEKLYSKHLELDSPYNTYRYAGLPPGPIANPGLASLEAAVEPDDSRELYFVALPGRRGHAFSEDLEQHNRAVARWRAYVRSAR